MIIIFTTFPSASDQGIVLNNVGIKERLVSYLYSKEFPDILPIYSDQGTYKRTKRRRKLK